MIAVFAAAAVLASVGLLQHFSQQPAPKTYAGTETAYRDAAVVLPALSGLPLSAMVYVLETPVLGAMVARVVQNSGPFAIAQSAGRQIQDEPQMYPVPDLHPDRAKGHAQVRLCCCCCCCCLLQLPVRLCCWRC